MLLYDSKVYLMSCRIVYFLRHIKQTLLPSLTQLEQTKTKTKQKIPNTHFENTRLYCKLNSTGKLQEPLEPLQTFLCSSNLIHFTTLINHSIH